jgi:hypothetical protein
VTPETAARLQKLDIAWFATEKGYTMFTRGICAAVAHGPSIGSSGLMTENGFAYLVWREERAYLVAHGGAAQPATDEQVEAILRFSKDLKGALCAESPAVKCTPETEPRA